MLDAPEEAADVRGAAVSDYQAQLSENMPSVACMAIVRRYWLIISSVRYSAVSLSISSISISRAATVAISRASIQLRIYALAYAALSAGGSPPGTWRLSSLPEDSLRAYYDRHPDEFTLERPLVRGIYLKVPSDAPNLGTLRRRRSGVRV